MPQKYKKNYQNLSSVELTCILKSHFPHHAARLTTTPQIMKKIKEAQPDFDKRSNSEVCYYFTVDNENVCTLVEPTSESESEYISSTNPTKNAFAHEIDTPPSTPSNTDISELQAVVQELSNSITSTGNFSKRSKFSNLKFKIQFDESKGIHHFLNSVERFSQVNGISEGRDRVLTVLFSIPNRKSTGPGPYSHKWTRRFRLCGYDLRDLDPI